jgi:hypothetical protein
MSVNKETRIEIIKESVRRFEAEDFDQDKGQKSKASKIYDEFLEFMKNADLRNARNLHLESKIKDFLYKWGSMGRVLGQPDYFGWERALVEEIIANRKELEELRMKDLLHESLDTYQATIIRLYDSFRAKVKSSIAAVKTLHLICPDFFPLWDTSIANGVRAERSQDEKEKAFSAEDYYHFMKDIQGLNIEYKEPLTELALKYKKTKLKILDEFLLWTTSHPFSFFLPPSTQ